MNNKDYFKYSQENVDGILDFSKPEGMLVISKQKEDKPTELMEANKKLINLITTYETEKNLNIADENHLNNIVGEICKIIDSTKQINYSPFCSYLQVIGYSYSSYITDKDSLENNEKIELMKQLINLYIENRHNMYLSHGYSDQALQVNSDNASSRRKGKTGIDKMLNILVPLGFSSGKKLLDFESQTGLVYILPDKGDKDLFIKLIQKKDIQFEFRKTRQNKNPDMVIKIANDIYIVEHKLTNGGGGSQNMEINEIISFISYTETKNNYHYISCLEGNFFQKLNGNNQEPKAKEQYQNIITNLNNNLNNYFVNGKGFKKLIEDLVKDQQPINPLDTIDF